jgi:hypothetical protein
VIETPRKALLSFLVVTALSAYTERAAQANGRFPRAQTVLEKGDLLVLRATFGLLLSHDRGKSWDWICEQAMGFSGAWDPPLALGDDGTIFIGLEKGLRSTKDGCGFVDHHELDGQLVSDLTEFHGETWAATSTPGQSAFVWRTQGGKFVRWSKGIPGTYIDTLDVYRGKIGSSPGRVYLTGIETGKPIAPHFYRSDDDGVTFTEQKPAWPHVARLFIAAIDPIHPERVFVRSLGVDGSDLLLTEDAGKTFRVVLHFDGAMFGFAMNGDDVWAGSGTPTEGLWRSTDRGRTFSKVRDQLVYCLRAGSVLYACSEPYVPQGYALASSRDNGTTWEALGNFTSVRGPVACAAGDGAKCVEPWAQTKLMLATNVGASDAGTGDAAGEASAAPASSAPSSGPERTSRCGCMVVGAAPHPTASVLGAAALAVGLARRRRRRAGSPMVQPQCPSSAVGRSPTR